MAHPTLFSTPFASGFVANGPAAAYAPEWKPLEPAKRLLRRLGRWTGSGYRPELHYMRGGRTAGAKSLGGR